MDNDIINNLIINIRSYFISNLYIILLILKELTKFYSFNPFYYPPCLFIFIRTIFVKIYLIPIYTLAK